MRYQVTFRKRFDTNGVGSDLPQTLLDLPDGVILDSEVIQETEPDSIAVDDEMGEDDLTPFGHEIWEYVVADARKDEFVAAMKESGVVLEFDEIEDEDDGIDKDKLNDVYKEADESVAAGGNKPESELE
jgi:hypothetical protein